MGLLELIIIILVIMWALGGLLILPVGGGVLNILITIVLIWIIWQLLHK